MDNNLRDILQKKYTKAVVILISILIVFFIGNYTGKKSASSAQTITIPADINVTSEQFEPFWKVWRLLSEKYVSATTTDSQKRIWTSIQGLTLSQGDPYTVFFPPEENAEFKSDIAGNFEGVGMEIALKDNVLTVVAPLKGSPAEKAGMKTGDKILKINNETATGLAVDKAVKLIRGPKGTVVKITLLRPGVSQQMEISITRGIIDIPTLETQVKEGTPVTPATTTVTPGKTPSSTPSSPSIPAKDTTPKSTGLRADGIFVIKLYSFTAQAAELFRGALREFVQSGSHKLIFDLRGNPGGYLDAAWDMASWFLPAGEVIVTEDFGGKKEGTVYRSKGYNIFNDNLKFIILVDGGSASASEIFAGALQEHGRAKLVGTKTFGKGSVQELIPITSDTSLKVTIARWLTPKGHNLSHDGLNPDVVVPITQKDLDTKTDPQMDKAVEILRAAR